MVCVQRDDSGSPARRLNILSVDVNEGPTLRPGPLLGTKPIYLGVLHANCATVDCFTRCGTAPDRN